MMNPPTSPRATESTVPGPARFVVFGAVIVLVIAVYFRSANSGTVEMLAAPDGSYYNLLVKGFHARQLNLPTEVPAGLARLEDPYNEAAFEPYRSIAGNPLHDLSYYRGKFYLYFGVTPALVAFWPYTVLTGNYLLHKHAGAIFFSIAFLLNVGLFFAIWRRYFREVSLWIVALGAIALGLANLLLPILERCDVWEVAISCGQALTMFALVAIWKALHCPNRTGRWLAAASLAYGLAVGARPSLLFGAVILLVPVVWQFRNSKFDLRDFVRLLSAAVLPAVLVGIGLMWYNAARFGDPLEFGQHYQLPRAVVAEEGLSQFSVRYFWCNFRLGFLQPARWGGDFPFVNLFPLPPLPRGADAEMPFGILTNVPLVWLALAVPLAWRRREPGDRTLLRSFVLTVSLLFAVCATVLLLHNSMCLRYEVEFAQPLLLLAVIGILGLERAFAGRSRLLAAIRCGWLLLLGFSVVFNLLAGAWRHREYVSILGSYLLREGKLDEAARHFQKLLIDQPNNTSAMVNLGRIAEEKGRGDEAVAYYERALRIQPGDPAAHVNLGTILRARGRIDEAIAHYRAALATAPDLPEACYNLGNVLVQKGELESAIERYERAIAGKPDYSEAHSNLGNVLLHLGRYDAAIGHLQRSVTLNPDSADAHGNLGNALLAQGRIADAVAQYESALTLQSNHASITARLAWILSTSPDASLRDGKRAVELAAAANQLSGGTNPEVLAVLAAAYAEAGRFPEAIAAARQAISMADTRGDAAFSEALKVHLRSYEAGRPVREGDQTDSGTTRPAP